MPAHFERKILPFSSKQMLEMITNIESYPQFLPWCSGAKIIEKIDQENLIASLNISFKGFSQKYISDVKIKKVDSSKSIIEVKAIEGPFKNLINHWQIKELPIKNNQSQVEIEFFIDFEFRSIILEKMMALVFEKATEKMIDAFEKRAHQLYDKIT